MTARIADNRAIGATTKKKIERDTLLPLRSKKPSVPPRVGAADIIGGSRKRQRTGPCYFGHEATSGKTRFRAYRWNVCPRPSPWPNHAQPGDTLCQKCYQLFRRHHRAGTAVPLPADYEYTIPDAAINLSTIPTLVQSSTSTSAASSSGTSAVLPMGTARPPGVS